MKRVREKILPSLFLILLITPLFLIGISQPVAAVDVTGPVVITSPGTYVLKNDIANCTTSPCINISSYDVFFEGSGYTIDGRDSSNSIGISVYNATTILTNVIIANLTVRDWSYGIYIREGQQGRIENITAESNPGQGIQLRSTASYTLLNTTLRTNSYGINMTSSSDNTVIGTTATANTYGAYLASSHRNTLTGNTFSSNTNTGLYLLGSYGNIITVITANSNTNNGCYLSSSHHNILQQIMASSNAYGIILSSSVNNTLADNTLISNTNTGLQLLSSNTTSVSRAIANGNRNYGILLTTSPNNTFSDITATGNQYGVYLTGSSTNTITSASMNSNTNTGIYLTGSSDNTMNNISANSNTNYGVYLASSPRNALTGTSAMSNQYGVYLTASGNTTISNMVASGNTAYGIYLATSGSATLADNIANSNANMGIYISTSDSCTLTGTRATSNANYGIRLVSSHRSILTNNTASYNLYGISLSTSNESQITTAMVNNNINSGLYLVTSHGNILGDIAAINNTNVGIYLDRSNNNTIFRGVSAGNTYAGIYITASMNNTLREMNTSGNTFGIYFTSASNSSLSNSSVNRNTNSGIYLASSHDNIINRSRLHENTNYGIYLSSSQRAIIYDNYLNNTNNVGFGGTLFSTTWNGSRTAGTNIMNGPFIGGNFWGKPDWSGFSQTMPDTDGDGLCDSPYSLTTGNIDYLPLRRPLPSANFSANVTTGQVPLTVSFSDTSTGNGIGLWYWDFGDGNTSTSPNPVHVYEIPGTYDVYLRVTNDGGWDWENRTGFITVTNQTPAACFTAWPTFGQAPLSVEFTDTSSGGGITLWYWDFGDGNTSLVKNPIHRYDTSGMFNVSFRVTSDGGWDWENRTGYVNVSPQPVTPRPHIRLSGGGSAQGTSTFYAERIPEGEEYTFITGKSTPVSTLKVCLGDTVTDVFLYLERISSLPENTPSPPSAAYGYFSIVIKSVPCCSLHYAYIDFIVPKAWLLDHGIDSHAIDLNMFRGNGWIALPVQYLSEKEGEVLYRAKATDLSHLYSITGRQNTTRVDTLDSSSQDVLPPPSRPNDGGERWLPLSLPYLGLIGYGAIMFILGFFCKSCLQGRDNSR